MAGNDKSLFSRKDIIYDPATGEFRAPNGRRLDYPRSDGYREVQFYGRKYVAHHLAWFKVYGYFPTQIIDHINRDKGDNRIENLREVDAQTNQRNKGQKGYYWDKDKQKWRVQWSYNNRQIYVGLYDTESEAQAVYAAATAGFGII